MPSRVYSQTGQLFLGRERGEARFELGNEGVVGLSGRKAARRRSPGN